MAFDIVKDCDIKLKQDVKNGLAATAATGLLSTLAVTFLLVRVAFNASRNYRRPSQEREKIFRTHIDIYFFCLLIADLIQGFGAMTNIRWVLAGRTFCSVTCTAQGILKEIGENGVAWFTLVITIHTFCAIFFQWVPPRGFLFPGTIICGIVTFIALFVGINAGLHPYRPGGPEPYYAPTPFYCWISKGYGVQRIMGEYFWLWLSAFLSILLYVPLYFCLRGNIRVDPSNWGKITFHLNRNERIAPFEIHTTGATSQKEAIKMLGYPVAYVIVVLPMSIGRWLAYKHVENQPGEDSTSNLYPMLILVGACIFGLSGVINVILFLLTRPKLLSLNQPSRRRSISPPTVITIQRSIDQYSYRGGMNAAEEIMLAKENLRMESPLYPEDATHYIVGRGMPASGADWDEYKHGIELPVRDPFGRLMLNQQTDGKRR